MEKKVEEAAKKKEILIIADMVGYGKVAMGAMLPILQYLGLSTCNLPTSLISNPFEYGDFAILDTTPYIKDVFPVWKKLDFRFEAIATGYLVSETQAEVVSRFCFEQARQGAMIFTDPIMGDEGDFYNGVGPKSIKAMREMLSVAHLCYPNYTEACLLTGTTYHEGGVARKEAMCLLDGLRQTGCKSVLITSIEIDGQPSVAGYNHQTGKYFTLPYTEIPVHFPGTGDIFSAVLIGHLLRGEALESSTQQAMDAVYRLIDNNRDMPNKKEGLPLEKYLNLL